MTATATATSTLPVRLRQMAESMRRKIDDLGSDRLTNTPKRQREAMRRRCDATNLEAAELAALLLATAHEAGDVPPAYASIRTRAEIERLTRRQTDSQGYYHVCLSEKHVANDDAACGFRSWLASQASPGDAARQAQSAATRRLEELDESVKFSNIPGFFPTPPAVIERMLEVADIAPGMIVLEPSAGKGDLAVAADKAGALVSCWEINHRLCEIVRAKGIDCACGDFLAATPPPEPVVDLVLMNPPFEDGASIEHVRKAFEWLRPGGRLVAVMPTSIAFRTDHRHGRFTEWREALGGTIEELPDGSFKSAFRPTAVNCVLLVVDKPGGAS